jgi:hypothetical protein
MEPHASIARKTVNAVSAANLTRGKLRAVQDRAQSLEKQVVHLQEENLLLRQRIAQLEQGIPTRSEWDEFIEHRGALFKKRDRGGYDLGVYCPSCRGLMISFGAIMPFACNCGAEVDFSGRDLHTVINELP